MGIVERKEREKERRRKAIVLAAEEVFFTKGLAQATMDEIADRAELSKGTLYLYYGSKEDLYLAVMCKGRQILLNMFENAARKGEGVVEQLRNICQVNLEFYLKYRNYFRMSKFLEDIPAHSQVSEKMMSECSAYGQEYIRVIEEVIQKGINRRVFRQDLEPLEMTILLWLTSKVIIEWFDQLSACCKFDQKFSNLDLARMLHKAHSMTVYAMLTDEARKDYGLELQAMR